MASNYACQKCFFYICPKRVELAAKSCNIASDTHQKQQDPANVPTLPLFAWVEEES